MTDTLGGLPFPVPLPATKTGAQKTRLAGDPALSFVASFAATVLAADCGDSWAVLDPGIRNLPDKGAGTERILSGPVRAIVPENPMLGRGIEENDAPILFAFRAPEERGGWERFAEDVHRRTTRIVLQWYYGEVDHELRRERDIFTNAIGASLGMAFHYGRHAAWVLDQDLSQPETILLSHQVSTSQDEVLSGASLDGLNATTKIDPARSILVSTKPASGAYDTTKPIEIIGVDPNGKAWSDTVMPTNTNGGEALPTVWQFSRVTQVKIPRQLLASNRISIGWYEDPNRRLGSNLRRAARISALSVARAGEPKTLRIQPLIKEEPPYMIEVYEVVLQVVEDDLPDTLTRAQPITGALLQIAIPNGDLFKVYETAVLSPSP